jgi:predicted dithiol-disulfide oxidoreductase (DUF899 family)
MENDMPTQNATQAPNVVSREQWVSERQALLTREKELTHLTDEVSRQRRALPWVRLEKAYTFHGPAGEIGMADLFQGRSQLIVYHFMYGPEMKEACPSCSFVADHFDATLPHLGARDVALAAVSRAPYPKLEAFKRRMGWRFTWVSSSDTDFNFAFGVSSTEQQREPGLQLYNFGTSEFLMPEREGASVFARQDGEIFHTYSTYGRGVETLMGTYHYLDLVPKGRDEDSLDFTMAWVRYHDRYQG